MASFEITGLDLYRARVQRLTGSLRKRTVELTLPQESIDKLGWLDDGGRRFTVVNALLAREMTEAFAEGLDKIQGGAKDMTVPWRLAAEAWRDRIATRLATSGGDVRSRMRKLKPATIKRKGFDKIGVDTGALLRSIVAARVVIR